MSQRVLIIAAYSPLNRGDAAIVMTLAALELAVWSLDRPSPGSVGFSTLRAPSGSWRRSLWLEAS